MCIHQQDFHDSRRNVAWHHSRTQHKQTSQTPIMEHFQMLQFFIRISLTGDLWTPAGRRKGLPWPRGAYLGASWGFSWLKYRQERVHWQWAAASVIDLLTRVCAGIPGAVQADVGPVLMDGPEGVVCRERHGHVRSDLPGSGAEPWCLYTGHRPEFDVCGSCALPISCYTHARTHSPRRQYLKLWLITNRMICCLRLGSCHTAMSSAPLHLLV